MQCKTTRDAICEQSSCKQLPDMSSETNNVLHCSTTHPSTLLCPTLRKTLATSLQRLSSVTETSQRTSSAHSALICMPPLTSRWPMKLRSSRTEPDDVARSESTSLYAGIGVSSYRAACRRCRHADPCSEALRCRENTASEPESLVISYTRMCDCRCCWCLVWLIAHR